MRGYPAAGRLVLHAVLWAMAGVLAATFFVTGLMTLTMRRESLAKLGPMGWVLDFPPRLVKIIGGIELLAACGLVVPAWTHTATILVPYAASGLVVLMFGAAAVHVRRGEGARIAVNAVIVLLAGVLAWCRFGTYHF